MRKKFIFVVGISAGTILSAADAAGSVGSVKGLQLNGQAVPVAGTKSWPVASGDELKSDGAPVVLQMKDGSKIVLGKNSQARVDGSTVRLMVGSMRYDLAPQSELQVAVKNDVLPARTGLASTTPSAVAPASSVTSVAAAEELPPVSRRKP